MPEKSGTMALLQDMGTAAISGGVVKTITAPIERVKLLMQTQDANPDIRSGKIARYSGMGDCFSRVASTQGIPAFWRGNGANLMRYVPQMAFNLSFKDAIKRQFPKVDKKKEFGKFFAVSLASAGLGAAGSLCICYPLDYARTVLATDVGTTKKFNGIIDCIAKTAKASGPLGLYNGFGASVTGVVAYRGVQLGCFDVINSMNPYAKDLGIKGIVAGFSCGMAGLIASLPLSYPFDTVRRRQQMESDKPAAERRYGSMVKAISVILKEEGLGGLYKGVAANIVRGAGAAMVPVLYEKGKVVLGI